MRILVVEDEILIADFIRDMLVEENFMNVMIANDKDEAMEMITSFKPQIIILDININGEDSGIELCKNFITDQKVIYLTAQNDRTTILKALNTVPEAYLTKPVKKADLISAVELIRIKYSTSSITIKHKTDLIKINMDEILYIKSDKNYLDIFTTSRKYTIRQSMDELLMQLNGDFFKIHRSFIINKTKVEKVNRSAVFIDNTEIPISRSMKFEL